MKLALGTAQFGLDYGISNKSGQTPLPEVKKILKTALNAGVSRIDTAPLYGNSEEAIGNCLESTHSFKIITKTGKNLDTKQLETDLNESFKKLKLNSIYGLMLHDASDLIRDDGKISDKLNEFKEKKLVEKIGVSVYTSEQIDKVLEKAEIDIIQLPINVFDQRLLKSGHLKKLKENKIEIYARSIFLQGLLLMEFAEIDSFFELIKPLIKDYFNFLESNNITKLQAALSFVKNVEEIDYIVCGVNNNAQLVEIISAYNDAIGLKLDDFSCCDETFINPTNWRLKR